MSPRYTQEPAYHALALGDRVLHPVTKPQLWGYVTKMGRDLIILWDHFKWDYAEDWSRGMEAGALPYTIQRFETEDF